MGFSTLDIGYSGLKANQIALDTIGHNIANANNEKYSRQVAIQSSALPSDVVPGSIGRGVQTDVIIRVHDEYTFARLKSAEADVAGAKLEKDMLAQVGGLFTDLAGTGIANDLQKYYDAWNDLSSHPTDPAAKLVLTQNALNLSNNIKNTNDSISNLSGALNTRLESLVGEINEIGQQVANLNNDIARIEVKGARANDLRDERDHLELTLSKLIDFNVFKGNIKSEKNLHTDLADRGDQYVGNIAGFSFIDEATFHPIVISKKESPTGSFQVYSQRQDGTLVDMTHHLQKGEIGSIINLRGSSIDETTGKYTDGVFSEYTAYLDSLANGVIEKTNNIYAKSATPAMVSSDQSSWIDPTTRLSQADKHIENGSFEVVIYDSSAQEVARKTINIADTTTIGDIEAQINTDTDDNNDNSSINDVDDLTTVAYNAGVFSITANSGYTVALVDKDTNFPGVMGMNQFFEGTDASNINVASVIRDDPTVINAYGAPFDGGNDIANEMVQLQYDQFDFTLANGNTLNDSTLGGFYSFIAGKVASDGQSANGSFSALDTLKYNIDTEYKNITGVNIDEELTNLLKFQTGYSANAKVISAIDKMMDTLLGMVR